MQALLPQDSALLWNGRGTLTSDLEAIQAMQATCLPIEANGYIQVIEATCLPATPEEAKLRLSRRLLRLLCIEATRLPARYPRTQLL